MDEIQKHWWEVAGATLTGVGVTLSRFFGARAKHGAVEDKLRQMEVKMTSLQVDIHEAQLNIDELEESARHSRKEILTLRSDIKDLERRDDEFLERMISLHSDLSGFIESWRKKKSGC